MRFPGRAYLRQLKRELFPSEADLQVAREASLAAVSAEIEAEERARKAEADALRRGYADKLRPYVGHLIVVTNFKGTGPENAVRIRGAVLDPANLGADTPIGIGAVLSSRRRNHEQLMNTANALVGSFASAIGERALLLRPQLESSDLWLLALARTAKEAARQAGLPPEEVGCIAVVSALDMNRQANIPEVPDPGTAFKLTHISEEAHFGWEPISVPPNMWGTTPY